MRVHRGIRFGGVGRKTARAGMVLAGMLAAACAAFSGSADPADTGPIVIDATQVPLNPDNAAMAAIGDFVYAGGLALTSKQTGLLHGLSDLVVTEAGRLTAVGDEGILLEARIVLDAQDRLTGVTDARVSLLLGDDGQPLTGKESSDAEGLTELPSGDRLVSFERLDRVWLYPAGGGRPRAVPAPTDAFPLNAGMEALTVDPEDGADAYLVGAEDSGDIWSCRVSVARCAKQPHVDKPGDFGLVAIAKLPGGRTAQLLRAYDVERGNRIALRILAAGTEVARMDMAPPLTVDNFEGLAAIARGDGHVRFYLISDDNGSARQRTLLLAFDWRPQAR